jgi:hypothetical protein
MRGSARTFVTNDTTRAHIPNVQRLAFGGKLTKLLTETSLEEITRVQGILSGQRYARDAGIE